MKLLTLVVTLIGTVLQISKAALFDQSTLTADTTYGKLEGIDLGESYGFIGVPFAKPPVGPLRFSSPKPLEGWNGTYKADVFGIGCMQYCSEPWSSCPTLVQEDCLYLNIFTPKDIFENPTKRGVLVFMHGGNFRNGAGGVPLYDGRFLANKTGIIVVTINYRLGAFGWLYLGEMFDPDAGEVVKLANFGMDDQRMAFQYVQDNIAVFGGDPNKVSIMVTISGQSAGAQSAGLHLVTDRSNGLFQQLFMISNPFALPYKLPEDALKLADVFAEELGCPPLDLACLRSKDAVDVQAASERAPSTVINPREILQFFEQWNPTVGEGEYPPEPVEAFEQGKFTKVPTMAGTVTEEGRGYIYGVFSNPVPWWMYRAVVRLLVPNIGKDIIEMYPPMTLADDQREILNRLITDYIFLCSTSHVSQMMASYGVSDVYNYVNDAAFSFYWQWGSGDTCYLYPCHGGDLVFIFRTAPLANETFTPGEQDMVDAMTAYIGNFVETGNPNTPVSGEQRSWQQRNLPYWPQVYEKPGNTYTLYYSACKNSVISGYRKEFCDFLDIYGYYGVPYLNSIPESMSFSDGRCHC
ncbi:cAMP-regulated D2 protein [Holothuria leucospilota]|uniref:cAMP-regulated D2 protein n=1 Tax=Holothuria leucospilota TaxID=206669 RepID=A0A9Q1CLS9_HOLLE|nr:cAMP-regulated D2 protein [Holothuria leucospilota]